LNRNRSAAGPSTRQNVALRMMTISWFAPPGSIPMKKVLKIAE